MSPYAGARGGVVSFAVKEDRGRLATHGGSRRIPSASLVKPLLLAAQLRATGSRAVDAGTRALLSGMIRRSDNTAAIAIYRRVGREGVRRAARAAGMRRLSTSGPLFDTGVTASDMARLMARVDRLVPSRHRALARRLLLTVVPSQRWGIPSAVRGRWTVLFKGGWRSGIVHQAALVERTGGERVGIAVLTVHRSSQRYGQETIRGIAARLLPAREIEPCPAPTSTKERFGARPAG